ncbi:hypothetical protein [Streptomyces sp. NPDC057438]|uniref:hypothetical protein n=1 Tax=Streptomyces sp. NPDC057438 TaxID=3346133 RepID=UPI0036C8D4FF
MRRDRDGHPGRQRRDRAARLGDHPRPLSLPTSTTPSGPPRPYATEHATGAIHGPPDALTDLAGALETVLTDPAPGVHGRSLTRS